MQSRIQKWGNSLALRIPHSFAQETGLDRDVVVEISVQDGRLVIAPAFANVPTLGELLDGISPDNLHTEVETGPAQGDEAW
jgi:antitoxin MazE